MEAITHFFSGIFIRALLRYFIKVTWIVYLLLFPLGIAAHFFIDAIVVITFHTPTPRLKDKVWVAWHIIIVIGSIIVALVFTFVKPYFWALVAPNIPDIYDWLLLRPILNLKKIQLPEDPDKLPRYFMHHWIGRLRARCFSRLPDLREQHKGILTEIIIWASCFIVASFFL